MTNDQINTLASLLEVFTEHQTDRASIYGRRMDLALATDLRCALIAYGANMPNQAWLDSVATRSVTTKHIKTR